MKIKKFDVDWDKIAEKEIKWVCKFCGKSTKETDYEYLYNINLHLDCFWKSHKF